MPKCCFSSYYIYIHSPSIIGSREFSCLSIGIGVMQSDIFPYTRASSEPGVLEFYFHFVAL